MTSRLMVAIVTLAVLLSALPWEVAATAVSMPDGSTVIAGLVQSPGPEHPDPRDPCANDCACLCCPGGWVLIQAPASEASTPPRAEHLIGSRNPSPSDDLSHLIFPPPRLT